MFFTDRSKTVVLPVASAGLVACSAFPAFAEDTQTVVTSSDWSAVITSITNQISVSTIISALAIAVAAGIGLVFMWWGLRKATSILMKAAKSGKLKI